MRVDQRIDQRLDTWRRQRLFKPVLWTIWILLLAIEWLVTRNVALVIFYIGISLMTIAWSRYKKRSQEHEETGGSAQ